MLRKPVSRKYQYAILAGVSRPLCLEVFVCSHFPTLIVLQPRSPFYGVYVAFLLSAHLAFIMADNFFRVAALIGLRRVVFLETGVIFFGADFPFNFAHRCFIASEMRLRAAALIRRRFLRIAVLAWFLLSGRPRRAGCEPSPARAAIAWSIRLASCLSLSLIHISEPTRLGM